MARAAVDLLHLRVVRALVDGGSLAAAARALPASPSTIYRSLDELRRGLHDPVVVRGPAGYAPTLVGARIARLADLVEAELRALQGEATAAAGWRDPRPGPAPSTGAPFRRAAAVAPTSLSAPVRA